MSFAYSHRLRRGVNRQSHALKVAKLGGMPQSAIDTADKIATWLDANHVYNKEDREKLSRLGQQLNQGLTRLYCAARRPDIIHPLKLAAI